MVSYKKLWKLLIDKDMRKQDLAAQAKIGSSTLAKMAKGENVNMNVLVRICNTLKCDISDIVEVVPSGGDE